MKKIIMVLVLGFMIILSGTVGFSATIDLTDPGNSNIYTGITAGDGSIWRVVTNQPTGTGVIEPFLRLQHNGTEVGLNTDATNPGVYDDKGSIYTHSLKWGDLGTVTVGPKAYYQFTFDINEPPGGG